MTKKRILSFAMVIFQLTFLIPSGVYASKSCEQTKNEESFQDQAAGTETDLENLVLEEPKEDLEEEKEEDPAQDQDKELQEEPEEEPEEELEEDLQEESVKADMSADIEFIIKAAAKALAQNIPDMESDVISDFIEAGNLYDALEETQLSELPADTAEAIETVRERISQVITTDEGITASANDWYVKTNVNEADNSVEVMGLLQALYLGSAPKLLYHKNINYTDVRTGDAYRQTGMISLTFPVPTGYEQAVNPKIFTLSNAELIEVTPVKNESGDFYIQRARSLTNLIVVDLPTALTGISLEKTAAVNQGQEMTLKVSPVPADTTQSYNITWKSSNTKVAKVNKNGVVTGVKAGTANITASVKGNTAFKSVCKVTVVQGAHTLARSFEQVMKETKTYMRSIDTNPAKGSEWFVLGLARGGMNLNNDYFSAYYNHMANYLTQQDGILTNSVKYTEYSKAILVFTAIGKDATNIAGYNLFEPLADFEMVKAQGINGPIWALTALKSNPDYSIPKVKSVKEQTTEENLIQYILDRETAAGGWALFGDAGDPDITGMALQALSSYYNKSGYENVTAAINRALTRLSKIQNSTGGFSTTGLETSESCSQIITALCALGIDPETDERFIKGGNWTVENLLSYHITDSGFMHVKPGSDNNGGAAPGEVNGMATEQCYYAMVAYQRLKDGKTGLYDMSDLTVKKGGKGDGSGTGIETPQTTPSVTPGGDGKNASSTHTETKTEGTSLGKTASGKSASTQTASDKKKSDKKKSDKKTEDGWEFEGQAYTGGTDIAQSFSDTADADTAVIQTAPQQVSAVNPAGWLAAGICLGGAGTGTGMILYRKRKGRKKS